MQRTHHDLRVWQLSIRLVERIYRFTHSFPDSEKYGLVSQMRRAAVSIPSNIAEGAARSSKKEFIRFLYIARGSLSELETQLLLAKKLGFAKESTEPGKIVARLFQLITGLLKELKS